jgi:thiamine-phosphate pyrophosphorylase
VSRFGEAIAPEEAGCQLFLISPPALVAGRFADDLDAALAVGGIAGFLLCLDEPAQASSLAPEAQRVCRERGVAFLIHDDLPLTLELGADGLHLSGTATVRAARGALGGERILGTACGLSRDRAMTAGEDGADYIALGAPDGVVEERLIELLGWWSELFVLPCLALAVAGPKEAAALARAGADFVGAREVVWGHPQGPAAGVRAMRDAIIPG